MAGAPGDHDGVLDSGEQCDDPAGNSDTTPDTCRTNCQQAGCNDGVLDSGEQCDDSTDSSNAPDAACRLDCLSRRCGDDILDSDEECDDGGDLDGDGVVDNTPDCDADCTPPVCGDAVHNLPAGEACDPTDDQPNTPNSDGDTAGCDRDCTTPGCSDGVFNTAAGEVCENDSSTLDSGCPDTEPHCNSTCTMCTA